MPEEITQEPQEGQPQEPITQEPQQEDNPQSHIDYEKSYKELQSKFNQRDEEIKTLRKSDKQRQEELDKWTKLGQFIEANPDIYESIQTKINGQPQPQEEKPDDVRMTISSNIVKEFETKYGITNLDSEKAQALRTRIGQEIQKVSGKSVNDIPLSDLEEILEKGYTLATSNDKEEQARREGYLEARQNREAEFGSIPSSGVKGNQKSLTPDEAKVARRLGISEEDYLKYK